MKFRLIYFVFLSLLFLGFDSGGCSDDDDAPVQPPTKDYIQVYILARAYTYYCPEGEPKQETEDQYLVRFEFSKNNVSSSVNDALSELGYAFSYIEFQMYQDDYFSVIAKVQGTTTGDWQEKTLFYNTALANCDYKKEYVWRPRLELCVSY